MELVIVDEVLAVEEQIALALQYIVDALSADDLVVTLVPMLGVA